MSNNTFKHISDQSVYSVFDPTGTNFPSNVTTVQGALALTSPTQQATETQIGVAKIATQDLVNAGIDDTTIVTPKKLNERLKYPAATTTVVGVLSLATNAEALTGTVSTKAIVPSSLKYTLDSWWSTKTATETANGVVKLSTTAAAQAGTDDVTAMTPLKVKQAIAAATASIPSYTSATESATGIVRLATLGQAQAGTLREGYAISPYTLANLKGSLTVRGIVQASTLAQANLGTDESLYISAKGYKTYNATVSNFGTVKLSETVTSDATGTALSSNAKVLPLTGGTVTGTIAVNGAITINGSNVASQGYVDNSVPVGVVQMWLGTSAPAGGLWKICNGGAESVSNRPALFAAIGYRFGGSGDVFYLPDMRGLFVRGAGVGSAILAQRGTDSKGKKLLGNGVTGGTVGQIQTQQVREHKHSSSWGEKESRSDAPYGATVNRGHEGSGRTDHDNWLWFTNDATEVEEEVIRDSFGTMNSANLIGEENRPWNMSVNYIIKVA